MKLGHEKLRQREKVWRSAQRCRFHHKPGTQPKARNDYQTQPFRPGMYEGKTVAEVRAAVGTNPTFLEKSEQRPQLGKTDKQSAYCAGETQPSPDREDAKQKPLENPGSLRARHMPSEAVKQKLAETTCNTAAPGMELIVHGPTASRSEIRTPSATTGPGSGCRR